MLEWITIITVVLIVGILLDGWRRMRNKQQGKIKMSLSMHKGTEKEDLLAFGPELPNGGARVIAKESKDNHDFMASEFTPEPELDLNESVPMLMDVELAEPVSSNEAPSDAEALESEPQSIAPSYSENHSDDFLNQPFDEQEPESLDDFTQSDSDAFSSDQSLDASVDSNSDHAMTDTQAQIQTQTVEDDNLGRVMADKIDSEPAVESSHDAKDLINQVSDSPALESEPELDTDSVQANRALDDDILDADEILGLKPLPAESFDEVFAQPSAQPNSDLAVEESASKATVKSARSAKTASPAKRKHAATDASLFASDRKEPGFGEPQDMFAETFAEEGDFAGVVDHSDPAPEKESFDFGQAVKKAVSNTVASKVGQVVKGSSSKAQTHSAGQNTADNAKKTASSSKAASKDNAQRNAQRKAQEQAPVDPEEVLVINVMAGKNRRFQGSDLLEAMIACGLRYGEMDIFHRHETFEGDGEILFSLANMMKPGSFDLTKIDYMSTPGVSLFMTMSSVKDPMQAFSTLAASAHHLGKQLGGELKDENRSVMTNQTLEHCRQRISDFQRKRHLQRATA